MTDADRRHSARSGARHRRRAARRPRQQRCRRCAPRQLAVLRMRPFVRVAAPRRTRRRPGRGAGALRRPRLERRAALAGRRRRARARRARRPLPRRADRTGRALHGRTGRDVRGRTRRTCGRSSAWRRGSSSATRSRTLAGRRVLIAHGDRDRMTSPRASAAYARAAEPYAESVTFVSIAGERHAMLRRAAPVARPGHRIRPRCPVRPPPGRTPRPTTRAESWHGALAGQPALVV